jgi:predicted MFS family arabinose efflux permease
MLGGYVSDRLGHRTGDLTRARYLVGVTGFLIAGVSMVPAALTPNPYTCVVFSCLWFFGLELTVGVSWAIPLDIGGDFAGSVAAVMNTFGNVGGAICTTILGFIIKAYGWNPPFLIAAVFCLAGAFLFTRIDATKQIRAS